MKFETDVWNTKIEVLKSSCLFLLERLKRKHNNKTKDSEIFFCRFVRKVLSKHADVLYFSVDSLRVYIYSGGELPPSFIFLRRTPSRSLRTRFLTFYISSRITFRGKIPEVLYFTGTGAPRFYVSRGYVT